MVDGYRRYFLKAGAAAGVGAFLGGSAGFLSGRQLAYEEFRRRFEGLMENIQELEQARKTLTDELNRARADSTRKDSIISEQQAKINQLSKDYRNALDVISLSDQLEAETVDALSLYNSLERQAIDKLYAIVAKYTEKLGDDRVKAERMTADILLTTLDQRTKLEKTISEKRQEIERLSKQLDDANSRLAELAKLSYIVWESTFKDGSLDGFRPAAVDESPSLLICGQFLPKQEDVAAYVVDDVSAPSGYNKALELVANPRRKGGTYVNAITAREANFLDNSKWIAYGWFRKASNEVQAITVNLNLVEDYTEYPCIFSWRLNPFDPLYGFIFVETENGQKNLHKLEPDDRWHYFEIEGVFQQEGAIRKVARLMIDNSTYLLDEDTIKTRKEWSNSFMLNLEVTNMWTNCDSKNAFVGRARWSRVGLIRKPID
jgi:flagellar biosynthesis chaperone FliJ